MDPTLLIILIFIVAPLIEKLLKAGKQDQAPPPRPRPRIEPRPEPQRPRSGSAHEPEGETGAPAQRSARSAEDDSAAAVLPDDLWEILTGERRTSFPPTAPPPDDEYEPEPAYEPESEYEYETTESDLSRDDVAAGEIGGAAAPLPDRAPRPVRGQSYDEMAPVRELPRVVSLEQTSFDPRLRHAQFHEKLDQLPPSARVKRRTHPLAADFMTDADLRRAIIMTEVLGKPKGLEQGD